jgi:hypothetical protein
VGNSAKLSFNLPYDGARHTSGPECWEVCAWRTCSLSSRPWHGVPTNSSHLSHQLTRRIVYGHSGYFTVIRGRRMYKVSSFFPYCDPSPYFHPFRRTTIHSSTQGPEISKLANPQVSDIQLLRLSAGKSKCGLGTGYAWETRVSKVYDDV